MNKALTIVFVVAATFQAYAQESIEGIWLTEEGDSKIEIYQRNAKYFGKIVWLNPSTDKNGNPVLDRNNPNRDLRNRPLIGIDMLEDIKYQSSKWYSKIYAPKRGLKMDVVLVALGTNKLELNISYRGFTRQQIWTRSTL